MGYVSLIVRACTSSADVVAVEKAFPSGATRVHRCRFDRADGSVYLVAWLDGIAVGLVLVTPMSKYPEIRKRLGPMAEVNGLDVAVTYRRRGIATVLMNAARAAADISRL